MDGAWGGAIIVFVKYVPACITFFYSFQLCRLHSVTAGATAEEQEAIATHSHLIVAHPPKRGLSHSSSYEAV